MERTRAYRRYQRRRRIAVKKARSFAVYGIDWFHGTDGKYSKGHIGCGCLLCKPERRFGAPSFADARQTKACEQDIREFREGTY